MIGEPIVKEIVERLDFLLNVGLDYLTLDRSARTLSGGESQRIRLATQIGTQLTGVLYVLDEPSIGLHPRDNGKLIASLRHLRDLGNSVLVVEHDREMIEAADFVRRPRAGRGRVRRPAPRRGHAGGASRHGGYGARTASPSAYLTGRPADSGLRTSGGRGTGTRSCSKARAGTT